MRTRKMMPAPASAQTLGKQPTNSQKLIYIAQKLGLNGIRDMQGSTVNIYDTAILTPSSNPSVLEFFNNATNKARTFTNFQNGSLNSGETLVMEEIKFYLVQLTAPTLSDPTTRIVGLYSLSGVDSTLMASPRGLSMSNMTISIANQTVVKDYQISEAEPFLNPMTSGITSNQIGAGPVISPQFVGQSVIKLESPPVLPPNQKLKVALEIPALGAGANNLAIVCVIGKFGSIYASKTTL